jgi:hypothetical protein
MDENLYVRDIVVERRRHLAEDSPHRDIGNGGIKIRLKDWKRERERERRKR